MRNVALPNFIIFFYNKQKVKKIMDLAEEILGMTGMRTANGGSIRSHCIVETEYSNNNLIKYIQKAVPGWKVVAPSEANITLPNFPTVNNQNSPNCTIKV